ncbi:MAG: J domain-containing protein [Halolamina sp.]|uniref:J domain-containing protein n=1 Tax=Halolamina sp. TaxID=1940283 RepID=UPI002FC39569
MSSEAAISIPVWLLAGIALGTVASVAAASLFAVGERLFPPGDRPGGPHVSSDGRRRQEIRAFLRAAEERFLEDHHLDHATVAFYLPARDVAITFDPQAYFNLAASETFVVLCEHEMPGANLGRRLPFEIDEGTVIGSPTSHPVDAAFAALGVSRNADTETVQNAYREQVKEVHPDQGGTEEAFKELRDAYTTAKNHAEG